MTIEVKPPPKQPEPKQEGKPPKQEERPAQQEELLCTICGMRSCWR